MEKLKLNTQETIIDKKFFKEKLEEIINQEVHQLTWEEKLSYVRQILVELDKEHVSEPLNKRNPWHDDELRLILQMDPTTENIMRLAKAFKRGYGSIEQIYRWAAEDQKSNDVKRPNDSFVKQIKRIASEVGRRAT